MAAISPRTTFPEKGVMVVTWPTVTENDTYAAVQCGTQYTDRTVEVIGTIGGATVLIKGSMAGSTYATLTGHDGSASFTANGIKALIECTPYIQPTHSGGSSQSSTVTIRFVAR